MVEKLMDRRIKRFTKSQVFMERYTYKKIFKISSIYYKFFGYLCSKSNFQKHTLLSYIQKLT